jgi:spore germination protein YaaH
MDDGIAAHLATTDLTTLALFSVTHDGTGALVTTAPGYRRITGRIGERLIAEAHERGVQVELVYTSFGGTKNARFFASTELQARTIAELTALVGDLGVDGVNVDVEGLGSDLVGRFGAFVGRLGEALRGEDPDVQLSVATTGGVRGAAMARAAVDAGAQRVFIMGYDYHWPGSQPGASAPMDRRDGALRDLPWTLDLYRASGVPAEQTLLGLPLYGVTWPVEGPEVGAPSTGRGETTIPRRNLGLLRGADAVASYDPLEHVEVIVRPVGEGWRATYLDSATSLTPKLALADGRGLAGAGFWAIGYERGQLDITELVATFRAGRLSD